METKSKFFEALAQLVASGESVSSAASTVGCANSTAYRISADPRFRQRVDELRTESVRQALGCLSAAATAAVATMVSLLECEDESVRLRAATAILDRFAKLSESVDLRERIEKLEAAKCE
jgi:hypothetical protein